MIEFILMIITIVSAILALIQKDLLKAAILTGFSGGALAVLFQILLAPDVALTQAIVGAAIAGEAGAIVGALSAVDKNNKNKK